MTCICGWITIGDIVEQYGSKIVLQDESNRQYYHIYPKRLRLELRSDNTITTSTKIQNSDGAKVLETDLKNFIYKKGRYYVSFQNKYLVCQIYLSQELPQLEYNQGGEYPAIVKVYRKKCLGLWKKHLVSQELLIRS